jgi:hypothetical protein
MLSTSSNVNQVGREERAASSSKAALLSRLAVLGCAVFFYHCQGELLVLVGRVQEGCLLEHKGRRVLEQKGIGSEASPVSFSSFSAHSSRHVGHTMAATCIYTRHSAAQKEDTRRRREPTTQKK